jgi:hypothetical protein
VQEEGHFDADSVDRIGVWLLAPETQKTLARRLSEADRVIVLNHMDGKTLIIRDEHLKKDVEDDDRFALKQPPAGVDGPRFVEPGKDDANNNPL